MPSRRSCVLTIATAAALLAAPSLLSAQSDLDSTAASEFLGRWSVPLDTPQGPTTLQINIRDQAGKVAATVSIPQIPDSIDITNITRNNTDLVMQYALDFQGTPLNASITLRPEGSNYVAALDFADGQFSVSAPANKED